MRDGEKQVFSDIIWALGLCRTWNIQLNEKINFLFLIMVLFLFWLWPVSVEFSVTGRSMITDISNRCVHKWFLLLGYHWTEGRTVYLSASYTHQLILDLGPTFLSTNELTASLCCIHNCLAHREHSVKADWYIMCIIWNRNLSCKVNGIFVFFLSNSVEIFSRRGRSSFENLEISHKNILKS